MNDIKNPCKDCKNRSEGCHGKCEEYKQYCEKRIQAKKTLSEKKNKYNMIENYFYNAKKRSITFRKKHG